MYTEDDTFNRLRRPTLLEMGQIIVDFCQSNGYLQITNEVLVTLLSEHNWFEAEYISEIRKLEVAAKIHK